MPNPIPLPELQALDGAARGETAAETGRRLRLSGHTIAARRSAAMRRLGARNITQAVALAMAREHLTLPTEGES